MKVLISGPRRGLTEDRKFPHLHIEVDLEELPKKGETIILNSGSGYVVTDVMWWVDGPENEAYWTYDSDYETTEGKYQIAHVNVEPSDYRKQAYTMDAARREGYASGRAAATRELRQRLAAAERAGLTAPEMTMAAVLTWMAEQEGQAS
jgi:hypothetical protein